MAVGSTPEELAALIKNEIVMYANLVKQIGYQLFHAAGRSSVRQSDGFAGAC